MSSIHSRESSQNKFFKIDQVNDDTKKYKTDSLQSTQANLKINDDLDSQSEVTSILDQTENVKTGLEIFDCWLGEVLTHELHLLNDKEKEVVFEYLDLKSEEQKLLIRLFQRKRTFIKVSLLEKNYQSIFADLNTVISSLISKGFLVSSRKGENVDLKEQLNQLPTFELKKMFKKHIGIKGNLNKKEAIIAAVIKNQKTQPTLFGLANWKLTSNKPQSSLIDKVNERLGDMVQLSKPFYTTFDRVHLIYTRELSLDGKSMTKEILVRMGRNSYPEYKITRIDIFKDRQALLDYEAALILESTVYELIGEKDPKHHHMALDLTENAAKVFIDYIKEYEDYSGPNFLLNFTAGHVYCRLTTIRAEILKNFKKYDEEAKLLIILIKQSTFRTRKRGEWYQRLALIYHRYWEDKKMGLELSYQLCIEGINDSKVNRASKHGLCLRATTLEKARLKLNLTPKIESTVLKEILLVKPVEIVIEGERNFTLYEDAPDRKIYRGNDGCDCTVENLALQHYQHLGYTGYHCEGRLIFTVFALLMYSVLFTDKANVFDTKYQSAPLDLFTEFFYIDREAMIEEVLGRIEAGTAIDILQENYTLLDKANAAKPSIIGLQWDFEKEDIIQFVQNFPAGSLVQVLRFICQDYRYSRAGFPDLTLWKEGEVRFAEVKGPHDKLSDKQKVWIDTLVKAGLKAELCTIKLVDEANLISPN